jgi:hypothetical protein
MVTGLLALGCAITFAAAAWAGPVDHGGPEPGSGNAMDKAESMVPAEVRERGERLSVVATQINALVDPNETGRPTVQGSEGYLFLRLSIEDDKLILHWKGDLPEAVAHVMATHPEVNVEVRAATYTANDYLDAQNELLAATRRMAPGAEARFVGIEHVGDRTGFNVILFDPEGAVTPSALRQAAPLLARWGLPVEISYVNEVPDTGFATRSQDDP